MLRVRRDHVESAVGAHVLRFVNVELERPFGPALPGDQRFDMKIFAREHFEMWSARGTTVPMITSVTSAFE